jgi:hypothetical protein
MPNWYNHGRNSRRKKSWLTKTAKLNYILLFGCDTWFGFRCGLNKKNKNCTSDGPAFGHAKFTTKEKNR